MNVLIPVARELEQERDTSLATKMLKLNIVKKVMKKLKIVCQQNV